MHQCPDDPERMRRDREIERGKRGGKKLRCERIGAKSHPLERCAMIDCVRPTPFTFFLSTIVWQCSLKSGDKMMGVPHHHASEPDIHGDNCGTVKDRPDNQVAASVPGPPVGCAVGKAAQHQGNVETQAS